MWGRWERDLAHFGLKQPNPEQAKRQSPKSEVKLETWLSFHRMGTSSVKGF